MHVHVNTPCILLLDTLHDKVVRPTNITQASIYAIVKYMLVPISGTTLALYLILRQLLKGSELLANGHRSAGHSESDASDSEDTIPDRPQLSCLTIEPLRSADIELLAATADGRHTASWVPSEKTILVTPAARVTKPVTIPLRNSLDASEILVKLALNDGGSYCAAATSKGRLLVWDVEQPSRHLAFQDSASAVGPVVGLFSLSALRRQASPPRANRILEQADEQISTFYAVRACGQIESWNAYRRRFDILASSTNGLARPSVLYCATLPQPVVARQLDSGNMELWHWRAEDAVFAVIAGLHPNAGTQITAQAVCSLAGRLYFALGDRLGCITVLDAHTAIQVHRSSPHIDAVRSVRLACCTLPYCPSCGTEAQDALLVVSSSQTNLSVERLTSNATCTCSHAWGAALSRSPSNSNNTGLQIVNGNHRAPSPRMGSADEGKASLAYPLSPHALRRLSHASDRKKAEDSTRLVNGSDNILPKLDEDVFLHSRDISSEDDASVRALWHHQHIGRLAIDAKTCWDVLNREIVGVRKRKDSAGRHVLSKWETWLLPLDKPQRDLLGRLTTQGLPVLGLLQTQADLPTLDRQLPFDRVRHFFVTRDGSKVVSSLGNLVIVSTPIR